MQNNTMFENFEDFQKFIKKEGKNIRNWSLEQQQAFSQNVLNLFENDKDFKLKYEAWTKQIEKQVSEQKRKIAPITLDTESEIEAIKNQIKLQQIREHKAAQNIKNIEAHKKDKPIVIGGTKKDNQENNIERQRAETAVFKRNVIGSFLESVNAEHTALKSLEKNEQEAKDSLKNLCMQLHNFDTSVNGESCEDKEDSECMESIAEDCAEFIMKNGGLAKDSFDDKYDVDCAQSGSGSYYETIFCKLNDLKDEAVKKAEEGYSDGENEYEGYNEVKGMEGSEKIEERKKLIENYLEIFKKTDADELSYVQPDATPEEVADAVEEAKANREASLDATEEGLTSMDNQSQAVPYAPVY